MTTREEIIADLQAVIAKVGALADAPAVVEARPPPLLDDSRARFERCLVIILKEEGGNDDDPFDHGGRTSRGVTQREYDRWRTHKGLPTRDVWTADQQEVHDIYYEGYWLPICPTLPPGVDLVYFNVSVNGGPGRARQLYAKSQRAGDVATVRSFCDNLVAFYRGLKQFPRYGRGWLARTGRIRAAATSMAQETECLMPPTKGPTMQAITGNPITSFAGVFAILPTVFDLLTSFSTKNWSQVGTDIGIIIAGLGLLGASDGTKR